MASTHSFTPPAAVHPNGTPVSPYIEAQQRSQDDIRCLKRSLTNWQRCNGVLVMLLVLAVGMAFYFADNVKIYPYVVEVSETGQIRNIGILPQTWRGQTPGALKHLIELWLYRMRRVGIDPVLLTEQLQHANAFMSTAAITASRQHVEEMFALQKKGWTTQIELGPLLPLTSDFHSVEIEWEERTYNKQGILQSGHRWKAIINVAIFNLDELKDPRAMRNPMWVFVTDYSWTATGPLTPEGAMR